MYVIMTHFLPFFFFFRFLSVTLTDSRCFCYALLFPYSTKKKILFFPLHPLVGLSLCILYRLGRIFFRYIEMSCFVFIKSPLFREYLLICLFVLCCQICVLLSFGGGASYMFFYILLVIVLFLFVLLTEFPCQVFFLSLFYFLVGIPTLSLTYFAPA